MGFIDRISVAQLQWAVSLEFPEQTLVLRFVDLTSTPVWCACKSDLLDMPLWFWPLQTTSLPIECCSKKRLVCSASRDHTKERLVCTFIGPVQTQKNSDEYDMQASHTVGGAGWQAKMASIEFWIPWRNAYGPHWWEPTTAGQLDRFSHLVVKFSTILPHFHPHRNLDTTLRPWY